MYAIALAVALLGAETAPRQAMAECVDQIAGALQAVVANPTCKRAVDLGFDLVLEDADAFLAGGDSMLGDALQKLDREGRLTEVLNHAQRARGYWRKGMRTPPAPGHGEAAAR